MTKNQLVSAYVRTYGCTPLRFAILSLRATKFETIDLNGLYFSYACTNIYLYLNWRNDSALRFKILILVS